MSTRRTFFKHGLASAALLTALPSSLMATVEKTVKGVKAAPATPSFKIGMAGYTFKNFNLDKTLEILDKIDVRYLCIKDFHLPLKSTAEEIAEFHAKLAAKKIIGYAVGPIQMRSEEAIDEAFEYAKRVGVSLIVGVPTYELLPYVEKKVKSYGMNFAIHLHGPDMPLFPNATDVWNHVSKLDSRMGMCLDIGHNLRDGYDPAADMIRYKERVFDVHIKDVTQASKEGKNLEVGRGVVDLAAFVAALKKVKYTGVCSLEYEKNMEDPFLGIAESIGYFKAIVFNS